MSHNLTLPEEVDIALMELKESDMQTERLANKSKNVSDQERWHIGGISPYRAAYLSGKENTIETR